MKHLLLILFALTLTVSPAFATLDGSVATLQSPGAANPGDTVIFTFEITNGSPDGEAINEIRLIFPGDSDVLSGTFDDQGAGWQLDFAIEGDWDEYAMFRDADGGFGEIAPGETGYFFIEVFLHVTMDCGPQHVDVRLFGDGVGEPQHWINLDDQPWQACGVPTVSDTWSGVKGLYR